MPSPVGPWTGAPLRVVLAAEKPLGGAGRLIAPNGSVRRPSRAKIAGRSAVCLVRRGRVTGRRYVAQSVSLANHASGELQHYHPAKSSSSTASRRAPPRATEGSLWPLAPQFMEISRPKTSLGLD